MFTRHVIMELNPNSAPEFTRTMESEVLPLLREQKGFRDEIASIASDNSEAIANSFWDTREDAEAYHLTGYPTVLKALSKVVKGTPRVGTAEVSNSTFYKIAAKTA